MSYSFYRKVLIVVVALHIFFLLFIATAISLDVIVENAVIALAPMMHIVTIWKNIGHIATKLTKRLVLDLGVAHG